MVVERREHPQHERREQRRLVLHVTQLEHAHEASPVALGLHEVIDVELRLTEERLGALLLELDHLPQQDADGLLRHAAVVLELCRAVAGEVLQHRAQVREVEQQQSLVVAVLEHERQHARLRVVETEHLGQEQRPERRDRRAKLRALGPGQAQDTRRETRPGSRCTRCP